MLSAQLDVPFVNVSSLDIDPKAPKLITQSLARSNNLIPVQIDNNRLIVAVVDPLDQFGIDDVRIQTGMDIQICIAKRSDIIGAINRFYDDQEEADKAIKEFQASNSMMNIDMSMDTAEDDDVLNSPMVRLVNTIINQAVRRGVSDIHIEPFEDRVRVRYRIDGELIEAMTSTRETLLAIVARVKIIGNMDISERRKPQDGRLETVIYGKSIDMRISILPTVFGEKVVIRLLDRSSLLVNFEDLNFSDKNEHLIKEILKVPEGTVLVTGPTGSGKTTTLYTILRMLNTINNNIITVEDPVEYRIDGINQTQVNEKAGLTFATALRSILRQEPDVIMVGEIRDKETAQIAIRASITGHIVLSTLHTNDTSSSVTRLIDMGIENYLVSSAISGVVAQRLVKKICPTCKEEHVTTPDEMNLLGIIEPTVIYRGKGCNNCSRTGYRGRTAIHEILAVTSDIRLLINSGASADAIKDRAIKNGMDTLQESCRKLILKGETTIDELIKVAYTME
ncbi:MAG: GspE/PulE family protein [Coprobacillaceae bacterium]